MSLSDQLLFSNDHWTEKIAVADYRRHIFKILLENLSSKEVITLIGTRRVGKTTLLKQLIHHLIYDKQVDPKHIIYFSFDLYQGNLIDLLNNYRQVTQIDYTKEKLYLILDEIQYLSEWASKIKFVWDQRQNIKIVISGSSSSELFRGRESLAGRELEVKVDPLSFDEYVELLHLDVSIDQVRWDVYMQYMRLQLPELALYPKSPKQKIGDLVDKVINYDLKRLYNLSETQTLYNIFRIICKDPGQIIIFNDLAKDLNIDPQTVRNYLKYLEDALLIRKLYNFTGNARKSEKAKKRYYPYFPTLVWFAYPHDVDIGKLAETEIAFQLNPLYFWNERGKKIDFIIDDIGIEAKMRNRISKSDISALENSSLVEKKFVIHKPDSELPKVNNIDFLPLHHLNGKNFPHELV